MPARFWPWLPPLKNLHRAVEPSSGSNVIPRRARPGRAGLRPLEGGRVRWQTCLMTVRSLEIFISGSSRKKGSYFCCCGSSSLSESLRKVTSVILHELVSNHFAFRAADFGLRISRASGFGSPLSLLSYFCCCGSSSLSESLFHVSGFRFLLLIASTEVPRLL